MRLRIEPRARGACAGGQGAQGVRDAWELGQIGRYYAVEDMLTTDAAEKYGSMSLREHYENVARNGQEYAPYTTVFAKNPLIK